MQIAEQVAFKTSSVWPANCRSMRPFLTNGVEAKWVSDLITLPVATPPPREQQQALPAQTASSPAPQTQALEIQQAQQVPLQRQQQPCTVPLFPQTTAPPANTGPPQHHGMGLQGPPLEAVTAPAAPAPTPAAAGYQEEQARKNAHEQQIAYLKQQQEQQRQQIEQQQQALQQTEAERQRVEGLLLQELKSKSLPPPAPPAAPTPAGAFSKSGWPYGGIGKGPGGHDGDDSPPPDCADKTPTKQKDDQARKGRHVSHMGSC